MFRGIDPGRCESWKSSTVPVSFLRVGLVMGDGEMKSVGHSTETWSSSWLAGLHSLLWV